MKFRLIGPAGWGAAFFLVALLVIGGLGWVTDASLRLEAAKLVERREDPDDRRAKTLHLTDGGRELVLRVNAALNDVRRRILQGATSAEIDGCLRVLSIIETNAKNLRP